MLEKNCFETKVFMAKIYNPINACNTFCLASTPGQKHRE